MNKYKQLYYKNQLELENLISSKNALFNPIYNIDNYIKNYINMLTCRDGIITSNKYVWKLPINLTSQQLEYMFYLYGSLAFYIEDNILKISRFVKTGNLNDYGQLSEIYPIDFAGKIHGKKLDVINNDLTNGTAIIINDYTGSFTDNGVIPRYELNKQTIKDESTIYKCLLNDMLLSLKKMIAFCENESQANSIREQYNEFINATSNIIVIADNKKSFDNETTLHNLSTDFNCDNYTRLITFFDKVRLNFNGVSTGDLFEKKERKITEEVENADVHSNIVLYDGYFQRLNGVNLINKAFNLNIDVTINNEILNNSEVENNATE